MNKYDDIIDLPHWEPKNHPRMSIENRSAQFAPFAALTGYREEIGEVVRIVDDKIELNDDEKEFINEKLLLIKKEIKNYPHVLVTYFKKDQLKQGGKYLQEENNVKKIDLYHQELVMINNQKINLDDILKIEGVDALVPSYNDNGIPHYEVTVSTLTGLDKMVTMIQAKPSLADLVTFNVNFDFEYMDGMYDPSVYSQYGIVQHLYEDENGTVQNDVYIDNEIDLETTFHFQESQETIPVPCENCIKLDRTMVFGLYKDENGSYVVNTFEGTKKVDLKFNADNQTTDVTKRLTSSEVKYRDYITSMVKYYQKVARQALKELFSFKEDDELPVINKAQYKKLLKKAEKLGGIDKLSTADQLAIAVYEVDYKVMNLVAETTHNKGCGMGGEASFLAETTTYQMYAADGRALYTTLNGDSLVQKADDDGNPILDEFGEPIYEYADGSGDYAGFAEIFEQRAYQSQDEEGHLLFADADGNTVVQIKDEDGNTKYVNSDGNELEITESKDENGSVKFTYTDEEGNEQSLERQLTKYDNSSEFNNLKGEMNDLVNDVKNGKYPQGRTSAENENIVVESEKTENSVNDDLVIPSEDIIVTDDIDKQEEKDEMAI